jgi:Ni,Fe-hydrogenase III large subunit
VGYINEKIYDKNCVTSTFTNVFAFYAIQQAIYIADVWLTAERITKETKHWLKEQNF